MKRWLTIGLSLLCSALLGQYVPNNTQAFQFSSMFNPAFTGIENYGDFKLSYMYQWSGFGSNSPKFINLAYNMRVKQPVDLSYNSLRISDPTLVNPEKLPRNKRMIHGLGANLFNTQIGPIESLGGCINYSIHYPLSSKWRLAFGLGAVIENRKTNLSEIALRDPDPFIEHLLNSSTSQTDVSVRGGALMYAQNFYFGLSYLPLVNVAVKSSDIAYEEPFYRGSVQAGYAFQLNPDVTFKPSVLALLQLDNSFAIDYNLKAFVQDKIWLGVTYRNIKSGVALLGFNFNEKLTASYSYELSLGDFQQFNNGSHELVLSVRFNNFKRQSQYTW